MKYWPTPAQTAWLSVYVDGACIGVFPDNDAGRREKSRLLGLKGVVVIYSTPDDLMKFHACSLLTSRMLRVMSEKASDSKRVFSLPAYGSRA